MIIALPVRIQYASMLQSDKKMLFLCIGHRPVRWYISTRVHLLKQKQGVWKLMHETAFNSLPLRAIKPSGWLKSQLEIQASGFTGHLEEQWKDVGDENGWLGGQGESWERGPYYVDGLLPLAHLLEDETLIAKANRWIEWSLASQQENGMFGPARITSVNQDIDKEQDWWHYMIMLKVMMR